jgi:hypothetical protein
MTRPRHRRRRPRVIAFLVALAFLGLFDLLLRAVGQAAHHDNWPTPGRLP